MDETIVYILSDGDTAYKVFFFKLSKSLKKVYDSWVMDEFKPF